MVSFSLLRYQKAAEESSAEKKKAVSSSMKFTERHAWTMCFPSDLNVLFMKWSHTAVAEFDRQ